MAFSKQEIGFGRNSKIKQSIEEGTKKDHEEENKIDKIKPTKVISKEKKTYGTFYLYPSSKAKLKRIAEERGTSASQMIENWIKSL